MRPRRRTAYTIAASILGMYWSFGAAFAGIADSPLPVLEAGKTTFHVYSVPAFIRTAGLSTFFACTSTDSNAIRVGVEGFGPAGGAPVNDAVATSLNVPPGGMVIFGSPAVGISIDSSIGLPSRGSARILATSRKLACTAWVADTGNAPPTSSWQLTVVKRKTQKGD